MLRKGTKGIFASPPEPNFNTSELFITSELLEDGLKTLADENDKNMDKLTENDGYFKDGKVVGLIFGVAKKFDLPIEVKYLAVEVFDKFMTKHINELYEIVQRSSSKEKQLDWSSVESRITDQVPLRAVTCVQIASKLISNYKALTPNKVRRFLSAVGLQYSVTSVVKSEQRVLRTLDFRLTFTSPLTHVEMLLEVLRRNCPCVQVNLIHSLAVKILDIVYLQKLHIYKLLFDNAKMEFDLKLTNDYLFMASCVIVAAAYILDPDSNDKFIEQIALITCLEEADIVMLGTVFVKVAMDIEE